MGVLNDIKTMVGHIGDHFHNLSQAKGEDYADYKAASKKTGQDAKDTLHETFEAGKGVWSASRAAKKADKAYRREEKQTLNDFDTFMGDLQKVEELRRQLEAAEAQAKASLEVVQADGERLATAAKNSEDAGNKVTGAMDNLQTVVENGSQLLQADSEAVKAAKTAGNTAYKAHKQAENAVFKQTMGDDARQLGHDAKVAAQINGIRVGTALTIGAEVVGDVAIAASVPAALPAAVVPQVFATKQLVETAQNKINAIREAEAERNQPPKSGSGSEAKAA